MRHLPLITLMICIDMSFDTCGQKIHYTSKSVTEIIDACDSTKKICVFVTSSGHKTFELTDSMGFKKTSVATFFNTHFITKAVYQDKDSVYENDPYALKLKDEPMVLPAVYFLDNCGHLLLKEDGIKSAQELLRFGEKACYSKSIESQIDEKKQSYADNKTNKAFLLELLIKDSIALNDLLALISKDEYMDIDIIKAILYHEESIYGDGYIFISEASNRALAAVICCKEDNMSMDEIMYNKALDIIQNNMTVALNEKNESLFELCKQELKKVMTDKQKAEKMCNKAQKKF
jgi:hypothetical protein